MFDAAFKSKKKKKKNWPNYVVTGCLLNLTSPSELWNLQDSIKTMERDVEPLLAKPLKRPVWRDICREPKPFLLIWRVCRWKMFSSALRQGTHLQEETCDFEFAMLWFCLFTHLRAIGFNYFQSPVKDLLTVSVLISWRGGALSVIAHQPSNQNFGCI